METFAERVAACINEYAAEHHVKPTAVPAALARACGIKPPSIYDWLNGRTKKIAGTNLLEAAAFFRVNAKWLDKGVGPRRPNHIAEPKVEQSRAAYGLPPESKLIREVPIIASIEAGDFAESPQPWPNDASDLWLTCPKRISAYGYGLRVTGESMMDPTGRRSYPPGSIVFVEPLDRNPSVGDAIIARIDGDVGRTLKIFEIESGAPFLRPLNPQWRTIHAPFHVLGTVIGKWEE